MKLHPPPCFHLPYVCRNGPLQQWRLAFAMLAVVVGIACTDGYPTNDAPAIVLLNMTQLQRLAEMNTQGSYSHPAPDDSPTGALPQQTQEGPICA